MGFVTPLERCSKSKVSASSLHLIKKRLVESRSVCEETGNAKGREGKFLQFL